MIHLLGQPECKTSFELTGRPNKKLGNRTKIAVTLCNERFRIVLSSIRESLVYVGSAAVNEIGGISVVRYLELQRATRPRASVAETMSDASF